MTKSLLWDPVTKIWFLVMGSANPSKFCCCMVSQRGCFTFPKMSYSDDDVCMACKILFGDAANQCKNRRIGIQWHCCNCMEISQKELPTVAGRQYDSFATDPCKKLQQGATVAAAGGGRTHERGSVPQSRL